MSDITFEILIPFYKGDINLLIRLLDSIQNQKGFDFNNLIVSILEDDLKAQLHINMLPKYSFKINYKKHLHFGIANTRNELLYNAINDYIIFCDQDDYFKSDKALFIYKTCIEREPEIDLIVGKVEIEGPKGTWMSSFSTEYINGTLLHGRVFKKSLLLDNRISFLPETDGVEDYYLMLLAFQLAKKIKYIKLPLYIWAYNPSSVTHSAPNKLTWIRDNYTKLIYSNWKACKKLIEKECYIGVAVAFEQLLYDISKRFLYNQAFRYNDLSKNILDLIKLYFYKYFNDLKDYRKYIPVFKKLKYYKTSKKLSETETWLNNLLNDFKDKDYPSVSTIIVTYNHEKYIKQALESAINQEGFFKQEILISDDCSTDNTRNIIKEYVDKYPDLIKDISPKIHLGISQNYKQAISKATGDYIAFLEGDDYWLKGKLNENLIKFYYNNTINFSFNGIRMIKGTQVINDLNVNNKNLLYVSEKELLNNIGNNLVINLSACVFKKEALQNIPSSIFDKYLFSEIPLQFYFIKKDGIIGLVPKILTIYRHHDNGVWAGADELKKLWLIYITRRSAYDVANTNGKECLYKFIMNLKPRLLEKKLITQNDIDELENDYKNIKKEN